jgi:DUF4097 and DUF4098 domain-containing protein YvlB
MRSIILFTLCCGWTLPAEVVEKGTLRQNFAATPKLEVSNVMGSIRVTAGDAGQIEMVAHRTIRAKDGSELEKAKKEVTLDTAVSGDTQRIAVRFPGCDCGEDRRREGRDYNVHFDFEIRAPTQTAVDVKTVNNGDVSVQGLNGEFLARNVNGSVEVIDAGGSGSASTVNGPVRLSFTRNPAGAVSAKTINGRITAEYPRELSANLRFKTMNGDVFTDFPTTMMTNEPPEKDARGGRYVYRSNRWFGARVGNGGPEHKFETLNGTIEIRQKGQ